MQWIGVQSKLFERNPVTVARQIDYVFKQLWVKLF